ncbi:MAG: ATP-binding protein, partial [Bacteroidales bacterium]|nr:ATP-binding protein [Bacteroidales bacterium]
MVENYINRTLEATLLEAWKYFPVLAVTGPRQSGKSTLIGHLFPEAVSFSLKDVNVREFALNDPVAF